VVSTHNSSEDYAQPQIHLVVGRFARSSASISSCSARPQAASHSSCAAFTFCSHRAAAAAFMRWRECTLQPGSALTTWSRSLFASLIAKSRAASAALQFSSNVSHKLTPGNASITATLDSPSPWVKPSPRQSAEVLAIWFLSKLTPPTRTRPSVVKRAVVRLSSNVSRAGDKNSVDSRTIGYARFVATVHGPEYWQSAS